jgi:hypothetical protein
MRTLNADEAIAELFDYITECSLNTLAQMLSLRSETEAVVVFGGDETSDAYLAGQERTDLLQFHDEEETDDE